MKRRMLFAELLGQKPVLSRADRRTLNLLSGTVVDGDVKALRLCEVCGTHQVSALDFSECHPGSGVALVVLSE